MMHIEWKVDGMTCDGCSGRLNRVLRAADGIAAAEADHAAGRVVVDYDPGRIDEARIREAIIGAGFRMLPA